MGDFRDPPFLFFLAGTGAERCISLPQGLVGAGTATQWFFLSLFFPSLFLRGMAQGTNLPFLLIIELRLLMRQRLLFLLRVGKVKKTPFSFPLPIVRRGIAGNGGPFPSSPRLAEWC